jgi:hypothetical protein
MKRRLAASIAIGLVSAVLCPVLNRGIGDRPIDFMWSWFAARDLVAGRDVYAAQSHVDLIPYPLPAAIIGLMFVPLPMPAAAAGFVGLSSGLLAFGLLKDGEWWRLLLFASAPSFSALTAVQWSPLMTAVLIYPALMPLALAKPQFLIPIGLSRATAGRVAACAAFGAVTLAIDPTWPLRWLAKVGPYGGFVPVLACPALLLALWQWKDPRARHLVFMACMPQRYLYDSLMLWTIPRTRLEMLIMCAASWVTHAVAFFVLAFRGDGATLTALGVYVPTLIVIAASNRNASRAAERPAPPGLELSKHHHVSASCPASS